MTAVVTPIEPQHQDMMKALVELSANEITATDLAKGVKKQYKQLTAGLFNQLLDRAVVEGIVRRERSGKGWKVIAIKAPEELQAATPQAPPADDDAKADAAAAPAVPTEGAMEAQEAAGEPDENEKLPIGEVLPRVLSKGEEYAAQREEAEAARKKKIKTKGRQALERASELVEGYSEEDVDQLTKDSLNLQTVKRLERRKAELEETAKTHKDMAKTLTSAAKYIDQRLKSWAKDEDGLPSSEEAGDVDDAAEPEQMDLPLGEGDDKNSEAAPAADEHETPPADTDHAAGKNGKVRIEKGA